MRAHLFILLATSACADAPAADAPIVRLVSVDATGAPRPAPPEYLDGARAWTPLGFDVELAPVPFVSELPECGRRWYETGEVDCQLTIGIVLDPLTLERTGSDAAASREFRAVYLDDSLVDVRLAVAHEVGHILLDTPLHTQGGVMGGASCTLRDVDYELACETINICL